MNDSVFETLKDVVARRPLTSDEQASLLAWLAAHPEAQLAWDEEQSLTQALSQLPNAPVASNFTAQVMDAARRFEAKRHRRRHHRPEWLAWLPGWQLATAGVALVLVLVVHARFRENRRAELARAAAEISALVETPAFEMLDDFDSICSLPQAPLPDADELLANLQWTEHGRSK